MKAFFILILIIGFGIGLIFSIRWFVKWYLAESLNSVNRKIETLPLTGNLLGKFDYTRDEWKYAYQIEFTEYRNNKSILANTGIQIYEKTEDHDRESIPGTIYFMHDQIIINNGRCSKIYNFNTINFAGYGIKVLWANLEHSSFMKTLQMKTKIVTSEIDTVEEYNILIPSSANAEIERFSKIYNHNS